MVLAVSLLLTVVITYNFYESAKNKDKIRFTNEVNRLQSAIENKINLSIVLLKGGRGFIESNQQINHANFAEYVGSLEIERNYTGVQGIGYTQLVTDEERETLIKKMQAEGFANFAIFPPVEKKSYQVITHLEPSDEQNRKIIGFDISSNEKWNEALRRAAETGEAVVSAKVNLALEGESQPGFLIYLPVYKKDASASGVRNARKQVAGFIFSLFQANGFLDEIQNTQTASDIVVKIYDGSIGDENLLMQSGSAKANFVGGRTEADYEAQKEFDVTGKNWVIQFESSPAFKAHSSVGWTPVILGVGTVFSLLLFGMTYWETFARLKMQTTAAELFELQEQKQQLLENERAARLSAEQANKTKDAFIAIVSHELRTPLNTIAGWTRILETSDVSEKTRNLALEKIEKNLRSQTKLVEELLDYSQIISGTVKLEGKEFIFSSVFEDVFSEVAPLAEEKSVEFVKNNNLNGHVVIGDEKKFRLVIFHLLNNAVKFTHSGGTVETTVSEDNGAIRMTVKDNGKGISSEFLPYVFDRFTQADNSTTRASGGMGLGLTISNHIVKLHNGTIEVASEGEGKGAVFTVKVPHAGKSQ